MLIRSCVCMLNRSNTVEIIHVHSAISLGPNFLVHFDEATTVVDKHAVLVPVVDIHAKDEVECFGLSQ